MKRCEKTMEDKLNFSLVHALPSSKTLFGPGLVDLSDTSPSMVGSSPLITGGLGTCTEKCVEYSGVLRGQGEFLVSCSMSCVLKVVDDVDQTDTCTHPHPAIQGNTGYHLLVWRSGPLPLIFCALKKAFLP